MTVPNKSVKAKEYYVLHRKSFL